MSGAFDRIHLKLALKEASEGARQGGIPIGSVLVNDKGVVLGSGHNQRIQKGSPTLHGEMDALENAGRLPAEVLRTCTLYTTLSPCAMCTGAVLLYKIPRVVVGENVTFMGEEELLRSRGVVVDVLQDKACQDLLQGWIREHPHVWNEDIGVVSKQSKL